MTRNGLEDSDPERAFLPRGRKILASPSGSSLIEIVIATLILSFTAVGMAEFFASGRASFDREECKRVAVLLAQEALERTVTRPYEQVAPWTETRTVESTDYALAVTTEVDVPAPDLVTVRSVVTWSVTESATRAVSLVSIVSDT